MDRQRYWCLQCEKSYSQRSKLIFHAKLVHDTTKDTQCTYCDNTFFTKEGKKRHESVVHMGAKPYECNNDGCREAFSTLCLLRGYIRQKHKKLKCENCGREFSYKHTLVEHKKRCVISPPPKCSSEINGKCSVSFTTKRAMKAHMDSQHKNLTFVCEHCGETFTYKSAYRRHRMRKHNWLFYQMFLQI